jgi:hypothetical protein
VNRSIVVVVLLSAAIGCTNPTHPTPVPTVSGVWTGSYSIVSCSYLDCGVIGNAPPAETPQPLQLTLSQSGRDLTGTLQVGGWYPISLGITGQIHLDGSVSLQGTTTWQDESCHRQGTFTIVTWATTPNAAANQMSGPFAFVTTKHLTSCYYTDLTVVTALSLARSG